VTTETFLVVALVVVVLLVANVAFAVSRILYYFTQWMQAEARVASWIGLWKNEKERADELQNALRLEQIAHSVEE
jgi:hypothetical protein